jgi:Transmembrane secretion effector
MAGSGPSSSTWAPLRTGAFRTLWIAALVSNVGEWMQTVGAQWLLVHGPHAAVLVSLVQTADALPAVLFALVAGVLANIFRQHRERQTGTDLQYRDDAAALSDPPPQTDHYLATDVRE